MHWIPRNPTGQVASGYNDFLSHSMLSHVPYLLHAYGSLYLVTILTKPRCSVNLSMCCPYLRHYCAKCEIFA